VSAPQLLPHIDAVTSALTGADVTVGIGGAPRSDTGADVPPPYIALYPDAGRSAASSLADPAGAIDVMVQLTCVGETAEQAAWLHDKAAAILLAGPLAVDGRTAFWPELLGGPPLQRDDDLLTPLWYQVAQYTIRSTP
jgi:hypothetical protein